MSVRKREEERGKGGRKRPRVEARVASEFGHGLKHVRVWVEKENGLREKNNRERLGLLFSRERAAKKFRMVRLKTETCWLKP